jgi:hypothetical protein
MARGICLSERPLRALGCGLVHQTEDQASSEREALARGDGLPLTGVHKRSSRGYEAVKPSTTMHQSIDVSNYLHFSSSRFSFGLCQSTCQHFYFTVIVHEFNAMRLRCTWRGNWPLRCTFCGNWQRQEGDCCGSDPRFVEESA